MNQVSPTTEWPPPMRGNGTIGQRFPASRHRELGMGGMGVVYKACQTASHRLVALKVFRTDSFAREEWEDRMRRGADLWATLAHPHLVPNQRHGWWDGAPYLAAEYVPHGNLAHTASLADPVELARRFA